MRFIFSRGFWGCMLMLLGVLLLIRNVFGIDIPIGGIFWSGFFIILGVAMLSRPSGVRTTHSVLFDEDAFEIKESGKEYSTVFGRGSFDLRSLKATENKASVKISSVFGSAEVRLDENQPIKIYASGAFAGIQLPDGHSTSFGEHFYTTKGYKEGEPYIYLMLSAVFGAIEVLAN